jgi:hypothetical protein
MNNKAKELPPTANQASAGRCFLGLLIIGAAIVAASGSVADAQTPSTQPPGTGQAQPEPRHDAWRWVPQALLPAPTDPQQIRTLNERGAIFDKFSLTHVPLDQPQPPGGRSGYADPDQPEIPSFENEAIIVGTFEGHQVYLTPSHLSIYTDVKVLVEQVLQPGPTTVLPGQTIDVLLEDGVVRMDDGRTIEPSLPFLGGEYSIQPNHRYVFFLDYQTKGECFFDQKDWELVNGVAVPNCSVEVNRAREGQSEYSGLSESAFLEKLSEAILKHEEQ